MKFDLTKNNNIFKLLIDGNIILENETQLSICVDKIEQFCKLYFLKEVPKKGVLNKLAKGLTG